MEHSPVDIADPHALGARLRAERGPLYLKLATWLRRRVRRGDWAPGSRLPALDALAADLGVAVVTLRQAVAVLEREGLLVRHQGKGTFVAEGPGVGRWVVLRSDWSSLLGHLEGKQPRLLSMVDSIASPRLQPGEGRAAPVYRYMRRVHHADDLAYALIDIYLDRRVYRRAPERFDGAMVISTLAGLPGIEIARVRQNVWFTTADVDTADLLGIPVNAPVGEVRRVITGTDGTVLYVGEAKYRGDLVKLEFDIERPHP
ncbi:MAG: GntR family transcriptional regulator [Hyphomicrobiales bacterium]|nr:GntR family transcriptional regulator [Hyphomicrobiales bacterium]MCP5372687.1 GntR family transcriptional regulator [Hyphomicrobiales bacterium]